MKISTIMTNMEITSKSESMTPKLSVLENSDATRLYLPTSSNVDCIFKIDYYY